ncbi:AP-3 complex subunit sigma-2 isoform X2 [Rissa tridactyla]|uniref:AP-3 complex subunit sigma-2 isoform X2 n=1 Tax=Rissa tridactyla TaxID=75485 RepID=UPI0023BB0EA6|nr:AP-3 complex subunit sigma-2 isoform X2 [Rissa tridactyla]
MINAILVFNNHGKPRLVRFYQHLAEEVQQQIIRETFHLVLKRDDHICNFLECGSLFGGSDYKLIYRHYATLYFVFCVDSSESELGILDLIQVFVETLDKCFENVCELDLIFHMDKGRLWPRAGEFRLFPCAGGPAGTPVNIGLELQEEKKKGKEQWECLEYKVFGKLLFEPQPLMLPL